MMNINILTIGAKDGIGGFFPKGLYGKINTPEVCVLHLQRPRMHGVADTKLANVPSNRFFPIKWILSHRILTLVHVNVVAMSSRCCQCRCD